MGGGSESETSTLFCYMKRCDNKPHSVVESNVGKLMLGHTGKLRTRIIDQDVVNELISMIIIEHDLPYSFVENKRFKELILYLYPKAKIPSRHVVTLNVNKLYENDKQKLKQVLCKLPSRINLTANVWTSCTIERYIALAAHFVDNNWLLQSRINFLIFLLHILGVKWPKSDMVFFRRLGD